MDDSMGMVLDGVLKEYASDGDKLLDSALHEEVRMMVKAKLANVFLERLKSRVLDKLEVSRDVEGEFEAAVFRTWRKPFGLSDLLLSVCLEVSSDLITVSGGSGSSRRDCVREALVGLQANACLVFNEVLHLLKSGFPGGANLLWRALHEIVCVSYFISEHGEGVAKRFLDYEVVEAYFQAQAFLEYKRNVEGVSFSGGDFKVLQKRFNAVERMYGVDFVKRSNFPFGWIPRSVLRTRSFREVERVVGLGVFRPYYDLAGYGVFGGRNLLVFKLGVVKDGDRRVVVPVGPSNYGLADPGRSAAISLGQVTACLLMSGSGVKRLIVVEALRNLVDEICDAFGEVEAEFGKDSGS